MLIDRKVLHDMLMSAAAALKEEAPRLGEIDSRFGDGDHGVTMGKIAAVLEAEADALPQSEVSIRNFLIGVSERIMAVGGGSAGPLYGTFFEGLADPLGEEDEITPALLKSMFLGVRDAMFCITKARVGDKTMMDAVLPAVEAAQAAPDDIRQILQAAETAACKGARDSERYASKFGRARSYGERTVGTPDAGACSSAALFKGFAKPLKEGYV